MKAKSYVVLKNIYKRYRRIQYEYGMNRPVSDAIDDGNIKVILATHHVSRMQNMYSVCQSMLEGDEDVRYSCKKKKKIAASKPNRTEQIISKFMLVKSSERPETNEQLKERIR